MPRIKLISTIASVQSVAAISIDRVVSVNFKNVKSSFTLVFEFTVVIIAICTMSVLSWLKNTTRLEHFHNFLDLIIWCMTFPNGLVMCRWLSSSRGLQRNCYRIIQCEWDIRELRSVKFQQQHKNIIGVDRFECVMSNNGWSFRALYPDSLLRRKAKEGRVIWLLDPFAVDSTHEHSISYTTFPHITIRQMKNKKHYSQIMNSCAISAST